MTTNLHPSSPFDQVWNLIHGELNAETAARVRAELLATPEGSAALREAEAAHAILCRHLAPVANLEERILAELEKDLARDDGRHRSESSGGQRGSVIPFPAWAGWAVMAAAASVMLVFLGPSFFGPPVRWGATQIVASSTLMRGEHGMDTMADRLRAAIEEGLNPGDRAVRGRWTLNIRVEDQAERGQLLVVEACRRPFGGVTDTWRLRVEQPGDFDGALAPFADRIVQRLTATAEK